MNNELETESYILEQYDNLRSELSKFIVANGGISNDFKTNIIEELIRALILINFPATYDRED